MSSPADARSSERPPFDTLINTLADYVCRPPAFSPLAMETARHDLMDSMACMMLALRYPECVRLLGPVVPGATLAGGARVPGTAWELDPVKAAFDIGTLVRYLDFNDTWLAAEWGHPSDNIGAILAVADYMSRQHDEPAITVEDVLRAMVQAHEIQGVLALENSFNRAGLDHVLLVRVASTAVVTRMLGGDHGDVCAALSHAWMDGGALRAYRHAPNTGPRKSWAAGDATSRAVRLALLALQGELGYPSVLTAADWGFQDVLMEGQPVVLGRELGCYVMENVLFKIRYPAEFHAQTAVEAALQLHPEVAGRWEQIERIELETQEAGKRIIDKTGPLHNYADRDHCLQYMVAVPLLHGRLDADSYSDELAADPRIDALRAKMHVRENPAFTRDYFDADKRAIPNAVQVFFRDGSRTERVQVDYPVGHRCRRQEGLPLLQQKFTDAIARQLPARQCEDLQALFADEQALLTMEIRDFMDFWVL